MDFLNRYSMDEEKASRLTVKFLDRYDQFITKLYGEPCDDYMEGCVVCAAWKRYDAEAAQSVSNGLIPMRRLKAPKEESEVDRTALRLRDKLQFYLGYKDRAFNVPFSRGDIEYLLELLKRKVGHAYATTLTKVEGQ